MSRRVAGLYGSDAAPARQRRALTGGEIPVAVYGLGKMGLPLAAVYAETTGNVTGVDVDPDVVAAVSAGESPVTGEPGLAELVADQVERGRLEATTESRAAASAAAVHVVIVPTLLEDREPDLSLVEAAARDVAAGLEPGDLVIFESTLPPGSCRDVLEPLLVEESGLEADEFGLAFCPERTSSGTALRDIRGQYPKVVGGVDPESARAAALIYDELSDNAVQVVSDATTAEAVKVFEGVYRDVNIALANELARTAEELGVSVREAIETANALPMCDIHDPGPGVGGHCIPYYPHFLTAQTDARLELVRTARSINDGMPEFAVSRLEEELATTGTDLADASVLVLGVTYRPGVEETRASPAIGVIDALTERGATTYATDPLVDVTEFGARSVPLAALTDPDESTPAFDAAVLVTPHAEFDGIDWAALEPMVVLDGRDALSLEATRHRVVTLAGTADGTGPDTRPETLTGARVDGGAPAGSDVPADRSIDEHTPTDRSVGDDPPDGGGEDV